MFGSDAILVYVDNQLTPRQSECLRCIAKFIADVGHPPTLDEINVMMGALNRMTARGFLIHLKAKGYLLWEKGRTRTMKLTEKAWQEIAPL